ncbi:MAG: hypothetical protein ACJ713_00780 [Candidatus Sulfotelmatobacter sp.]|jgi:hypothetical protein
MAGEDWTMWLNVTNFALGLVTLIALLVVFFAVGWDLLVRKVGKAREVNLNNIDADLKALLQGGSHSFSVPEFGLTMADGGERIEASKDKTSKKPQE